MAVQPAESTGRAPIVLDGATLTPKRVALVARGRRTRAAVAGGARQ